MYNLSIDFVAGVSLAMFFLIQVEAFGFLFLKIISKILKKFKFSTQEIDWPGHKVILNIFIGLFFYTVIFFWIGIARILYPGVVIGISLGITLLSFFFCKRWLGIPTWGQVRNYLKSNIYNFAGILIFLLATLFFTFRPITAFDSISYHFPISKLFLQFGNIDFIGHTFSLQPVMTYFWQLWFHSVPLPTSLVSIGINFTYTFVVALSIFFAGQVGKKLFEWSKLTQLVAPVILGISLECAYWYGSGYNDLISMAFSLITVLYCYTLILKTKISLFEFIISLFLILGLSTIKFHTTIFAFLFSIYFLYSIKDKIIEKDQKISLRFIAGLLSGLFLVFFLPWFIRSYIFTGKIFFPIGVGTENWYREAGSNTQKNHWNIFLLKRLVSEILPYTIYNFSPVFLIGIFAIINQKFRAAFKDLYLTIHVSFWLIFAVSVVLIPRYFLAPAVIILFMGISFLNYASQDLKGVSRFTIYLIPVIFVVFSLQVAYLDDPERHLYLRKYQNRDAYLAETVGKNVFTYYPSKNSPRPSDLKPDEKIYVIGVNNTGYIQNPILEKRVQENLFKDLNSVQDFVALLKANNVRYLLTERMSIQDVCKNSGIKNLDGCELNGKYWEVVAYDENQESFWMKLK